MINYAQILEVNYPNEQWGICDNDYETLQWFSDTPKPTQAELDALWQLTENIVLTTQAKENRRLAYVNESDPIFFKSQRGEATFEEWKAKIAEIDARFPYPTI